MPNRPCQPQRRFRVDEVRERLYDAWKAVVCAASEPGAREGRAIGAI
jgi:hypothetical protein